MGHLQKAYIFIVCLVGFYLTGLDKVESCYPETCVYNALMANYNQYVRPASSPGNAIDVSVTGLLLNILNLDEKSEALQSVWRFIISWTDINLQWNSSDYSGTDEMMVPMELLWFPDIAMINSVTDFYQATFSEDFRAHVKNNGLVIWTYGGILQTSCSIDITDYPFDSQTCYIKLQNWAYTDQYVNITATSINTAGYTSNSLWELVSTSVSSTVTTTDVSSTYGLPTVIFEINLKRKTGYYIVNLFMPIALLCIATLGVFWLPPDCGEKISLGITVLLAFSVFQIVIMDNTPVNSEETPVITSLVMFFMCMALVSLAASMMTVYLYFKKADSRMPRLIRIIAFKGLAKVFCLTNSIPNVEEKEEAVTKKTKITPLMNNSIDVMAAKEKHENGKDFLKQSDQMSVMTTILDELRKMTQKLHENERDEAVMDEWKLLAVIIDRILFCVSAIVFLISILVILF